MAELLKYEGGVIAVEINEHGSGVVNYSNGNVAMVISPATHSYQFCYYLFDKNRSKTMLLGINEDGLGFCDSTKRKSASMVDSITICLTSSRGFVAKNGTIVKEWDWEKSPLSDFEVCPVNEHFSFKVKDQKHMYIDFVCDSIRKTFDVGVKQLRETTYLDNAKRDATGKLHPDLPGHRTLKARTMQFNEDMKAKRNLLHPKSDQLGDMVRDIVKKLENKFDGIESKFTSSSNLGTSWRTEALEKTLSEIPKLSLTGSETGVFTGYGSTLYASSSSSSSSSGGDPLLAKTYSSTLQNADGTWLSEVDIHHALQEANPPLKRSLILRANSGRYSDMLVVNSKAVSATNPTGMITRQGLPLPFISWKRFKEEIEKGRGNPMYPILIAFAMRNGDPEACNGEYALQVLNQRFHDEPDNLSLQAMRKRVMLFKIEVGEDSSILSEAGLRHLPIFMVYHNTNLIYAGHIGGRKLKLAGGMAQKPQLLIIEPNVKFQLVCEKTLRKNGCDTYLCLSVSEAVERIQQNNVQAVGKSSLPIIYDAVLISDEIAGSDVTTLAQRLGEHIKNKRTVLCGMVSVLGDRGSHNLNAVKWDACSSNEVGTLLSPMLAGVCPIMIQKPIKAHSIDKFLALRTVPHDGSNIGLNHETLYVKLNEILDTVDNKSSDKLSSSEGNIVGIRLSAEDVKIRGKSLVR